MDDSDDQLTLHVDAHWDSPYVFSCFVAMREKGLAFDSVAVSLDDGEQHRPGYAGPTITARVPALCHRRGDDVFWLSESSAIIEYLEEIFPAPHALPVDLRQRARARQVMSWLRSDLLALREDCPTTTIFHPEHRRVGRALTAAGQKAADKVIRVASSLLEGGRQHLADDWSIADADLALMLTRLIINQHPVPAALHAFWEAQWSRPSVRAFVDRPRLAHRS